MSLLEAVGEFAGSSLGSSAGSIATTLFDRRSSRKERQMAQAWEASRYQTAAADMEKAGLNRILALGSSASSVGQAQMDTGDLGKAGLEGSEQERKRSLLMLEKHLLDTQAGLNVSNSHAAEAAGAKGYAEAEAAKAAEKNLKQQTIESQARTTILGYEQAKAQAEAEMFKELGAGGFFLRSMLDQFGGGSAKAIFDLLKPAEKPREVIHRRGK